MSVPTSEGIQIDILNII